MKLNLQPMCGGREKEHAQVIDIKKITERYGVRSAAPQGTTWKGIWDA